MIKTHHPQSKEDRLKLERLYAERKKVERQVWKKLYKKRLKLEEAEHVLQEVKAGRQEVQDTTA